MDGTDVIVQPAKPVALPVTDNSSFSNLLDTNRFNHIWRVATVFANSGLVPKQFTNNPAGCFVGIQMAVRLEVDPFMFLQNIYMSPDGKPALYGQMAIALVNTRGGLVEPLDLVVDGEGDDRGCTATGTFRNGVVRSLRVDIRLAKAEGWYNRNTKWRSMPDQMLRYRAGAWFGRTYCPEALMGMQTVEEALDIDLTQSVDGSWSAPTDTTAPSAASRMDALAIGDGSTAAAPSKGSRKKGKTEPQAEAEPAQDEQKEEPKGQPQQGKPQQEGPQQEGPQQDAPEPEQQQSEGASDDNLFGDE